MLILKFHCLMKQICSSCLNLLRILCCLRLILTNVILWFFLGSAYSPDKTYKKIICSVIWIKPHVKGDLAFVRISCFAFAYLLKFLFLYFNYVITWTFCSLSYLQNHYPIQLCACCHKCACRSLCLCVATLAKTSKSPRAQTRSQGENAKQHSFFKKYL